MKKNYGGGDLKNAMFTVFFFLVSSNLRSSVQLQLVLHTARYTRTVITRTLQMYEVVRLHVIGNTCVCITV